MINWAQLLVTFLGILLGSGLIQFFITRKDNKEQKFEQIQKEFQEDLDKREAKGKERFLAHKTEIDKLNQTILELSKNDSEQSQYLRYIGNEIMGLAHDRLVRLTDRYQIRGAITLKEKATLDAIYQPYHEGLGGNGDGQAGYEYCMTLPIITEEKARELDRKIS